MTPPPNEATLSHSRAPRWDAFIQDLRYAVRGLKNRPGFTLAVVLTLALGIGANAAIFSVVDRLLFRPPPLLRDPAMVHRVYLVRTFRDRVSFGNNVQYARYRDLTNWTHSFARTAEFTWRKLAIGAGDEAREMQVGAVSASFFDFFDARPALGRYFTAAEDSAPAGAPVAVLGYGYWQTAFGGRREALGRTLQVGATLYTIIGVAQRGFSGLSPAEPPAVYVPLTAHGAELAAGIRLRGETWWTSYHWTWASMIAERKPGVTVAAANADLTQAYLRSYEAQATVDHGMTPAAIAKPHAIAASVLSERGPNESSSAKVATWVAGVALIVWLIACANVANLLLARALRRRREIAVRIALGVSRARLVSQLLTESLLLALLGGSAGVLVAQLGGQVLRAALRPPTAAGVLTDPRTLVFAGIAALVAGFLTGLAPVVQARRADLSGDLKTGAREGGVTRSRLRVALLVAQGALSVVLLVGAGLFVRSLRNVESVALGYDVDPVLIVDLQMRGVSLDSANAASLRTRLLEEARTVPGVVHASRRVAVPFWSTWDYGLHVAGIDSVDRLGEFDLNAVSPDYFATMGTRLLRGRGISESDVAGAPRTMVVGESMAKVLWPGREALGQCVRVGSDTVPCTTVVGVAENIKAQRLDSDAGFFYYYLSSAQFSPDRGGLFVRTRGPAVDAKEGVRRRLQALMPGPSYVTVTPLSDILGSQRLSWRLGATLFTVFGALALVLAAIGLYSVIAYNVAQRTQEMGVRIALGARMPDVARLVLSEGMKLAVVGIVLGGALALVVSRWVKPLLFDVSPRDPLVFAGVAVVLLAVAALASFVPARRAARVDPMKALRTE